MSLPVIIIGAGAAGLMCAISAAQNGKQVTVLDHANKSKVHQSDRSGMTSIDTH